MKKIIAAFASLAVLGGISKVSAQDIHFSQFYENSILRNPALTGIFSGEFKAGINYRQQWGAFGNAYNTAAASAECRVLTNREVGDYISFGLAGFSDKAGTINFNSQGIYPAIAYNKAMNDKHNSYLSVGFTGGYITRSVDMSKMTFSSQWQGGTSNNPSGETTPYKSLDHFDLAAGVSFNSSLDMENRTNFYVGASVFHLNTPKEVFNGGNSNVRLPMKWQGSAGLNLVLSNVVSLALHANYSQQQPYSETILGGLFSFHSYNPSLPSIFAFSAGAFYRVGDAIIPTVKIDYSSVSLGFSYDVTQTKLQERANGTSATEITLYIRSKFKHPVNPRDGFSCPRFESINSYPFNN